MSTSGVSDILNGHISSSLYAIFYNFLGAFDSTSFFNGNTFFTIISLIGLSLFLFYSLENKSNNKVHLIMLLWFIVPIFIFSWFIYKPARFYYLIIPSMSYCICLVIN